MSYTHSCVCCCFALYAKQAAQARSVIMRKKAVDCFLALSPTSQKTAFVEVGVELGLQVTCKRYHQHLHSHLPT